ncbi:hypothetical protein V5P93_001417 [Actinokineospora auranticolor]|uniref:Uncharacterized protein n=1 Tax=Actinokineospora auranticolor TaxID=155976 RepID=A0A2S6GV86_9PSEU|nr:hypothetical protein [Actinokineospora auranticolor]PPK69041.1 hypothetical protein CLV40_104291 [Actinokineospora auranticolor]
MAWSNQRTARKVVLGYVGVVTVVFIVVAVLIAVHDSPDASFAPVLAIIAALPASLVLVLLPEFAAPWDGIVASAVLVAATLVQAWILWLLFRGHRVGGRGPAGAPR